MARKKKKEAPGFEEQTATAPDERGRLTPVEIQQKVFRLAFRGYNERDVDEFLDRITENLAALHEENKRLQERVAEGGPGGGDAAEADRQSEAIVRQAREHASRLVEDAERRAAITGVAGGIPAGLPTTFLLEERQFLQQMASLIQGHAQRLKDAARRARNAAEGEQGTVVEPAEAGPPPEPQTHAATPPPPEAAAGGVALGSTAAALEPSVESEPAQVSSEPPGPEEATAPWSPVQDEPPPASPEGSADDRDPLVSAWESAFTGEAGDPAFADERPRRDDESEGEGEPSLRELFWGEE